MFWYRFAVVKCCFKLLTYILLNSSRLYLILCLYQKYDNMFSARFLSNRGEQIIYNSYFGWWGIPFNICNLDSPTFMQTFSNSLAYDKHTPPQRHEERPLRWVTAAAVWSCPVLAAVHSAISLSDIPDPGWEKAKAQIDMKQRWSFVCRVIYVEAWITLIPEELSGAKIRMLIYSGH